MIQGICVVWSGHYTGHMCSLVSLVRAQYRVYNCAGHSLYRVYVYSGQGTILGICAVRSELYMAYLQLSDRVQYRAYVQSGSGTIHGICSVSSDTIQSIIMCSLFRAQYRAYVQSGLSTIQGICAVWVRAPYRALWSGLLRRKLA